MALNKHMHPRNMYRTPPNFKDLAIKYPEFRKYAVQDLTGKVHIDFKNTDTLRALTTTLLRKDFDLKVDIPSERLVPTLPLRLNYILWIEDLLIEGFDGSPTESVYGLDVGTGSTCIYPLLGHRMNGWRFWATDSDDEALVHAKRNVENNDMQNAINVKKASGDTILMDTVKESGQEFDFTMCNPPFFKDDNEADTANKGRNKSRQPPRANNRPCTKEAITEGGEVSFITKMIEESVQIGQKVKIYTTMIGKKKSLAPLKRKIQEVGGEVCKLMTTEFCQGHTMRWGIAWTFRTDIRLNKVQTTKKPKEKTVRPVGFIVPRQLQTCHFSFKSILQKIEEILKDLDIQFVTVKVQENIIVLSLTANSNTWSHQRRKRRASKQLTSNESSSDSVSPASKRSKHETESSTRTESCDLVLESSMNQGNASGSNSESALVCFLFLRKVSENVILELQWVCGSLGKDAVHQVLQYFKNKIV